MAVVFARRMDNLDDSDTREILKLTERPEVISFAGGLPAPELFPVEELKKVSEAVLEEGGIQALQYSTTQGYLPLRQKIAERMNSKFYTKVNHENIIITSGSQQGLDFTAKLFLNEGDIVLCESPTYLGAISAFKAYRPDLIEVPTDAYGIIPEELEKILSSKNNVKFIYVIPDFQNPTGKTWSVERRRKFMEIVNKYEIPVLEDNPYGELRYDGQIPPSIKSMDEKGLVIFLGTFSKIFCPGLRIGWVAAQKELIDKYATVKSCSDVHTSNMGQREIVKFMEMYDIEENIERIKFLYRARRDSMIKTMEEEFPKEAKFTYPEGGLFTWVELPQNINARDVLIKSLENNVAFVPGGAFYPNGGNENSFRLNFSNMSEDRITKGIKRLGRVLKEYLCNI
ncbi:2-aminoadipate transaminase [Oxobacter pfennigii]|uniref:2-aminoadipate transaminase n=1 Tax=Oxobacter pfennigii TaxID=36849 RepID=A0A0P8WD33_9CLOT|nr:PLP-dependent aminotransferase family protein [Oxobacter pfennigii]KPU45781.1 2-aminoadipate transaminase [Oxobacter pfennigii]